MLSLKMFLPNSHDNGTLQILEVHRTWLQLLTSLCSRTTLQTLLATRPDACAHSGLGVGAPGARSPHAPRMEFICSGIFKFMGVPGSCFACQSLFFEIPLKSGLFT